MLQTIKKTHTQLTILQLSAASIVLHILNHLTITGEKIRGRPFEFEAIEMDGP